MVTIYSCNNCSDRDMNGCSRYQNEQNHPRKNSTYLTNRSIHELTGNRVALYRAAKSKIVYVLEHYFDMKRKGNREMSDNKRYDKIL